MSMNLLAAYGLLASALVFAALIGLLPLGILRAKATLTATAVALLMGIAPVLHGVFGAPSVTLLQLAILQLAQQGPSPLNGRWALGIVGLSLIFYPLSWGLGPFDPYALGYQPWPILLALLPLALFLHWRRQSAALLILSIDLAAYAMGIFPNLWDALIDPLLVLLSLACLGLQFHRRRLSAPASR